MTRYMKKYNSLNLNVIIAQKLENIFNTCVIFYKAVNRINFYVKYAWSLKEQKNKKIIMLSNVFKMLKLARIICSRKYQNWKRKICFYKNRYFNLKNKIEIYRYVINNYLARISIC
jgi:hypothetical protein